MLKLLLRLAINAFALWVAITFFPGPPGIVGPQNWMALLALAFVFGLVNALVRPLITLLTCPLIILTLGLGTLLINTFLFWLTSVVSQWLSVQYHLAISLTVQDFWSAFFGALVVTVVSVALSVFVRDEAWERRRRRERR